MKAVLSSLLLSATAVANAANCDVSTLSKIASTDDALSCKSASNFDVPVASTANTILTNLESFCANDACLRVLAALNDLDECSIEDTGLHQNVVDPIDAVCSTTRALRAADGSHVHSSGMDMGSASAEVEDSHEATSASTASSEAEDSHETTSASSGAEDSHDVAYSTSASASAGEEEHDSHDVASSTAGSTATTVGSTASSGTSTGSATTSGNSTSSSQAPSASSTSSAASISIAAGSVFLAAAAAFF